MQNCAARDPSTPACCCCGRARDRVLDIIESEPATSRSSRERRAPSPARSTAVCREPGGAVMIGEAGAVIQASNFSGKTRASCWSRSSADRADGTARPPESRSNAGQPDDEIVRLAQYRAATGTAPKMSGRCCSSSWGVDAHPGTSDPCPFTPGLGSPARGMCQSRRFCGRQHHRLHRARTRGRSG